MVQEVRLSDHPIRTVTTEHELRALIPPAPAVVHRKKISGLEKHGSAFIALARVAASATRRGDGLVEATLHGGDAGFATVLGEHRLRVQVAADEEAALENVRAHGFAGLLFLIPGFEETLRVNGRASVEGGAIQVEVEEAFFHCPKAFIRAHLWEAVSTAGTSENGDRTTEPRLDACSRAFLERAPFWFLATSRAEGNADVSPRGDPPGAIHVVDDGTVLIPDRPGNRLLDNYGNVLTLPTAGVLCLVPGEEVTVSLTGRAALVADPALLAPMAVRGKTPVVALRLELAEVVVRRCGALGRAQIWDASRQVERRSLPTLGQMMADQLEPGRLLNPLVAKGLDVAGRWDARKNLY
jgi:PPOX class probable FMN-dependent enzyme